MSKKYYGLFVGELTAEPPTIESMQSDDLQNARSLTTEDIQNELGATEAE